jgi:hypothetical protein
MHDEKKARLAAKGWKAGSAEEFLGMTRDESAHVELRLKLSDTMRDFRKKKRLPQTSVTPE